MYTFECGIPPKFGAIKQFLKSIKLQGIIKE